MVGLFDAFSAGPGIAAAGRSLAATTTAANKGAKKQLGAYEQGVGLQREALAPPLTNLADVYGQEQTGREAYLGALGIGTPEQQAAAKQGYQNYLQPINQYGIEDLFRYAGQSGTTASGNTQKDLYDYGYVNRFQPWMTALGGFNPLQAATAQGNLAGKLADIEGQYAGNRAGVFKNKFDTFAAAKSLYPQQVFGAQQGALANQWGAINAGVNLAAKAAGMGFG